MPKVGAKNGEHRIAINLSDLDRVDKFMRQVLLGGKLDLSDAIIIDKDRIDESAVAFSCDTLMAAATCDIIRSHDRTAGDFPTRVYLKRTAWSKVPGTAVLSKVVGGKVVLNPELFSAADTPPEPMQARRTL